MNRHVSMYNCKKTGLHIRFIYGKFMEAGEILLNEFENSGLY
jgi:hypothetical protein